MLRISNEGKSMIGRRDTTPKGSPSFVHSVTKKAMSPIRVASLAVNSNAAIKKTPIAIRRAMDIFFNCLDSFKIHLSTLFNTFLV